MFQTIWIALAYSYNVLLVLFIAAHLFVGAIISFLMGLYIGVYLSQNYEIPRINEPRSLWEKFLAFLEKNRRDAQKISVTNILRPNNIREWVLEEQSDSAKNDSPFILTYNGPQAATELETVAKELSSSLAIKEEKQETTKDILETEDKNCAILEANFATNLPACDNNTTLILTHSELGELNFKDISTLPTLDTDRSSLLH